MANASSATVDPNVGWKVDNRGYIHGGFDTPIFGVVKHKHNSRLTRRRNQKKKFLQGKKIPQNDNQSRPILSVEEMKQEIGDYLDKETS